LYSLNLTSDADFRLKNKARGIKNDPPLGDGWGHWVPEEPYQAYIKEYGEQIEVRISVFFVICPGRSSLFQPNICDSHLRAVDHANTKFSQGYAATGVGGVLCARHTLVWKNGLGNLQKGERSVGFDPLLFAPQRFHLDTQTWISSYFIP